MVINQKVFLRFKFLPLEDFFNGEFDGPGCGDCDGSGCGEGDGSGCGD